MNYSSILHMPTILGLTIYHDRCPLVGKSMGLDLWASTPSLSDSLEG
jgi:hypothetical protein